MSKNIKIKMKQTKKKTKGRAVIGIILMKMTNC